MKKKIIQFLDWFSKAKTWKKVVSGMACVVVFITVYALILPAITLENRVICGYEEHAHTEACYTTEATLICGKEDDPDHIHDQSCYEYEQVLTCTLPEHTHSEECYESIPEAIVDELSGDDNEVTDTTETTEVVDEKNDDEVVNEEVTDEDSKEEEKTEEKEVQEFNLTATLSDGNTVTVTGTTEVLPEEVEDTDKLSLEATLLDDNTVDDLMEDVTNMQLDEEQKPSDIYTLYDIKLYYDGKEIEPTGDLQLSITGIEDVEKPENVEFFHLDEENNLKEALSFDLTAEGTITVETDHFSVYGVNTSNATGNKINSITADVTYSSGTYYLNADITTSKTITITGNVTFNLNGHKLTYTGSNHLFNITGGTLTLMDGKETAETVSSTAVADSIASDLWGKTATYSNGTLTYYVTDTAVTNSATGETTETLVTHTVKAAGLIECSGAGSTPIYLNGGNFTMNSGMIAGSTWRAIYANSGSTINLKGGYICGNNVSKAGTPSGGAIYCKSGQTVNLTGTVIAGNTATLTGGGIYINNGTLNISDYGIIAGNTCTNASKSDWGESTNSGGGGVYAESSTVTMTGGFVTNNKKTGDGYFDGGAGFLLKKGSLTISGTAKITSNESASGGGGIKTARGNATAVYMKGGFVTSNYAGGAEGGGMNFDNNGVGYITAGYITNNSTNKTAFQHWGGGGLFCSDGAKLYVEDVLVTENSAGGFGGGIAGCSTGRVYICVEDGGAIFDNAAAGKNLSGEASAKSADREYAAKNATFLANGYTDYYCALSSSVDGGMLGGGTAKWTGSMDGVAVTSNSRDDVLTAANIMGLTANPSDTDKASAESATKVFINGNYSFTHGGGILANGYLLVGSPDEITVPARLNIMGTKQYLDGDDPTKDYLVKANLGDDETQYPKFHFAMVDSEGNVVATGENGWDNDTVANATNYNRITFDKPISLQKAGTFTYKIYETDETNQVNVVNDTNKFTIVITTKQVTLDSITDASGKTVARYQIQISNVKITDSNGKVWYNGDPGDDEAHITNMPMSSTGFVNYKNDSTDYTVKKVWSDSSSVDHSKDTITVKLQRNGELNTAVTDNTVVLNQSNSWSYSWKNLPLSDGSGNAYTYSVIEDSVSGYIDSYETTTSSIAGTTTVNQTVTAGYYWVPVTSGSSLGSTTYLIVSPDGSKMFYIDSNNADSWESSTFVKSVTNTSGSITIGGTTYTNWIANSAVSNNNKFAVEAYSDTNCNVFKNKAVTSYISNESNDSIKSTNGPRYGGAVKLSNGKLMIQGKQMAGDYSSSSTWRYVCYANGIFYASDSSTNAVVLYKRVQLTSDTTAKVTQNTGLASTMTTTITNTPVKDVNFTLNIHKVSAENTKMALKDAKFNLLDSSGNAIKFTKNSDGYYIPSDSGETTLLISSVTGYINIKELPGGTYTLHETEAPEDYGVAEDQTITLDENTDGTTLGIEVADPYHPYTLPESGGMGTTIIYVAGGALMAAAVILLISKKRMKDKE